MRLRLVGKLVGGGPRALAGISRRLWMCGLLLIAAASQEATHFTAPAGSHAPSPSESPSNFNHLVDIAPIQVSGRTDGESTEA